MKTSSLDYSASNSEYTSKNLDFILDTSLIV